MSIATARSAAYAEIDIIAARLADLADWETAWALRGIIDAAEGRPMGPPGTSEDSTYKRAYRLWRDA